MEQPPPSATRVREWGIVTPNYEGETGKGRGQGKGTWRDYVGDGRIGKWHQKEVWTALLVGIIMSSTGCALGLCRSYITETPAKISIVPISESVFVFNGSPCIKPVCASIFDASKFVRSKRAVPCRIYASGVKISWKYCESIRKSSNFLNRISKSFWQRIGVYPGPNFLGREIRGSLAIVFGDKVKGRPSWGSEIADYLPVSRSVEPHISPQTALFTVVGNISLPGRSYYSEYCDPKSNFFPG